MKKIDPTELATLIANIGVIGGLLLLVYEVRQNNELMAAEARFNRTVMAIDAWRFTAENPEMTEWREMERRGEELTSAQVRVIDSAVMAIFVNIEWAFRELGEDSEEVRQVREVQRYNFEHRPEYRRVWEQRRAAFDPVFVEWMEAHVTGSPDEGAQ